MAANWLLVRTSDAAIVAAARFTINKWAAAQTRDRMPELLADGDVTTLTRLVLTNAVYFKGKWEKPFRPDARRHVASRASRAPPTCR